MTQPTITELNEMAEADPKTRAVLEFIWAFTEWWEGTAEDGNGKMSVDNEVGLQMEQTYECWRKLR